MLKFVVVARQIIPKADNAFKTSYLSKLPPVRKTQLSVEETLKSICQPSAKNQALTILTAY